MFRFVIALSTWLHVLATIVWIGYYLFISLIYLHVLERQIQANALRDLLEQLSAHLRLYFGGALVIVLVTLSQIHNPVLILIGDYDRQKPPETIEIARHLMAKLESEIIPNAATCFQWNNRISWMLSFCDSWQGMPR